MVASLADVEDYICMNTNGFQVAGPFETNF